MLNEDIQSLYMIERRTILWKKEDDKAVIKEKQRFKESERIKSKAKSKKNMLDIIYQSIVFSEMSMAKSVSENIILMTFIIKIHEKYVTHAFILFNLLKTLIYDKYIKPRASFG